MITLPQVIAKVKQGNLTKTELESLYDMTSVLLAELQVEASELEQDEALFMSIRGQDESVAGVKIRWKATQAGKRLIVVKRYISAVKTLLGSIKNRIYSQY